MVLDTRSAGAPLPRVPLFGFATLVGLGVCRPLCIDENMIPSGYAGLSGLNRGRVTRLEGGSQW